jgi:hypothetical protein
VASLIDILLGRVVVIEWLTGTTRRWVTLLAVCTVAAVVLVLLTSA